MILCDTEIRAALNYGHIVIDPRPPPENIGTTAIDLRLGTELRKWKVPKSGVTITIDPSHPDFSYSDIANDHLEACVLDLEGAVVLQPGDFLLGITEEKIELPIQSRLAARVEGRSTLARLGIGVHVTAPTIHSSFRGKITLEITNQGQLPVRLKPGLRVCQLILEQVYGTPATELRSAFQDQQSVSGRTP